MIAIVILAILQSTAPQKQSRTQAVDQRIAVHAMMACQVKKRPDAARTIILSLDPQKVSKAMDILGQQDCFTTAMRKVGNQVRLPGILSEGMTAEALVRTDFANFNMSSLVAIPELVDRARPMPSLSLGKAGNHPVLTDFDREYITSVKFGECVVRREPQLARGLLFSEIGSTEDAAMAKMTPTFTGCVSDQVTVKMSRDFIRSATAIAYYRLAHAAQSLPVGKN